MTGQQVAWSLTAVSLIGAILNARHLRISFLVWSVGNIGWVVYFAWLGMWPQATLFFAYLFISVYGLFRWRTF